MWALLFFAGSVFSLGVIWLGLDARREARAWRQDDAAERASWEATQ